MMHDIAWSEFESALNAYVRRRVDANAVDDVVGDVLERLVRSRDSLAVARNPLAWVYRVAANTITDHHRRAASRQKLLAAVAQDPTIQDPEDSDAAADARQLARCLSPLMETLPAADAEALKMVEIDGMTQAAAAHRAGLSVSGMKSRVQRARHRLKAALMRCCAVDVNRQGNVLGYRPLDSNAGCGDSCG